ncbi:FKBP-type peptidyl-prolyl cis-trans isomerase [Paraurantiacibacter namhicola]|uniref:Peptidyl-prolyl cis-trans isomerase n=1 Tax=Paraurantiacibacter namhicola TaxID=645517 RepID=A0A1C7DB66_9SPHN|nr:FKBP-type peptidyl-prolyl cis-trans isomerase [Paraurantiacibacter namhicola]ANU08622.1 FKBP-type 22 kDa peptidyl-prolyl cis-trans isomerase [Paraurantiacibacter namhicola]
MAEVTRVPLQPIEKGSLAKLWLGVLLVVLVSAGIAWAVAPKGVSVDTITAGEGASPTAEDVVFIKYVGKLEDGSEFDRGEKLPIPTGGLLPEEGVPLPLEGMIPGFVECVTQMQKGGTYECTIPSDLAYGAEGSTNPQTGEVAIPPNSDLTFEVTLVDFMPMADFQQRVMALQQMMAPPEGAEGAEGAPAGGAAPEAPATE